MVLACGTRNWPQKNSTKLSSEACLAADLVIDSVADCWVSVVSNHVDSNQGMDWQVLFGLEVVPQVWRNNLVEQLDDLVLTLWNFLDALVFLSHELTQCLDTGSPLHLAIRLIPAHLIVADQQSCKCKCRRPKPLQTKVEQGIFQNELAVVLYCNANLAADFKFISYQGLNVRLQHRKTRREGQVEVQELKDLCLFLSQLIRCVGSISAFNEVLKLGWIDLLVLAGDQHRSYANELKFSQAYAPPHHHSIDQIHRDENRIWLQVILVSDTQQPVNED